MSHSAVATAIRQAASAFLRIASVALIASICVLGAARVNAEVLPECVHWTSTFGFSEFMDRARVRGSSSQRLYLRPANPELCRSLLHARDCKPRAYIVPNDIVKIGHVCRDWAYVMYEKKRRQFTGWVELDRLEKLAPDAKTLDAPKKSSGKPEGHSRHPLLSSALVGDVEKLRQIASSDVDAVKNYGDAALFGAVRKNHHEAVTTLLDLGVSINGVDACGKLAVLAIHSSPSILAILVQRGADINCKTDRERRTPLMRIAGANRGDEIVDRAMGHEKGRDLMGSTKLLLAKGAKVNDVDGWGASALRNCIESNNVDIASLLLDAGADVNNYIDDSTSIGVQEGNTTLMYAVSYFSLRRDPSMIALLLKHKADVNYRNELEYDEECDRTTSGKCTFTGQTALTRAVSDGYYTVVKLLLENGADPLLSRTDGRTPAAIACDSSKIEIAELIQSYAEKTPGEAQPDAPCTKDRGSRQR